MWYHQGMELRRLIAAVAIAGAGTVSAQARPPTQDHAPLTPAALAQAFARAMPYSTFRATDTEFTAIWSAADARASASVDAVMREIPPPVGPWRLLVVAENSCSDALASLPYLARLVDGMPGSELRILRRADGLPLVETHLLNGRTTTPLVLVLDSAFRERGVWNERAAHIQAFVTQNEGRMNDDTLWARVRVMRRDDDGRTPLREVIALMRNAGAPGAAAPGKPPTGKAPARRTEPLTLP